MVVALLLGARLDAQQYFGQNQVQYKHFDWQVIETEHWIVHYYPEEREGAMDAARMAERSYARLSKVLDHQFREKKPIVLFSTRSEFGQNNITGDLGEGTGGVTEASRHRMIMPLTGDLGSFEHVLTHEMVMSSSTTSSRAAKPARTFRRSIRSIRRSGSWKVWPSISRAARTISSPSSGCATQSSTGICRPSSR